MDRCVLLRVHRVVWSVVLVAGCGGAGENTPSPGAEGESVAALSALEKSSAASTKKAAKKAPSSPASAPAKHGLAGLAEGLTSEQIKQAMRNAKWRMKACYDQYRIGGTVYVRIRVRPDGTVQDSSASGALAGTAQAKCIAEAARKISFPAFIGGTATMSVPITFTE